MSSKKNVSLQAMCAALSIKKLDEIKRAFDKKEVVVTFPKFELQTTMNLGSTLQELGMPLPFSDLADFSGISSSDKLKIGAVVQKTYLNIDELGTKAAAATVVVMETLSAEREKPLPVIFKVDHPFVIVLEDKKTGFIVFVGKIMHPGKIN